jgi:hypothetical protein
VEPFLVCNDLAAYSGAPPLNDDGDHVLVALQGRVPFFGTP